ncbi:chorismate mutase [Bernardetia litoralis DSM 6794]|uniref:chorismate mutase n=1 Tax=Bernardetia litoralis (strain ATCC 23117 / DSM 6794 / NBRC 15988 / NCIMB 1366 / Fx l1 / Sio-4) TaxID=880071 RepID=I4AFQ4_BERLS|nr:chorismate mutase [Bernardetia litoralis]AFM02789.1 chorismate mutase [Bernardetia litoralis DSM 6794]
MNASQKLSLTNSSSEICLNECRQQIDQIDTELIKIIAQRMEIVKKIGEHKRKNKLETIQPNRWQAILDSRQEIAEELDLPSDLVLDIFEVIHQMAIQIQSK